MEENTLDVKSDKLRGHVRSLSPEDRAINELSGSARAQVNNFGRKHPHLPGIEHVRKRFRRSWTWNLPLWPREGNVQVDLCQRDVAG